MNKYFKYLSGIVLLFCSIGYAQDSTKIEQLEKRIQLLESKIEQSELEKIINEAESVSKEKKEKTETKIFKGGQRSLQALNPEISFASDAFGQYIANKNGFNDELRSGAHFRVAEMQVQSNLDPFSFTKIIIEFKPDEVEFAEAYLTWNQIFPNVSLTAGKFRQQFGVVNRWHAHALDQFEFPLALTTILGGEGLNQMGLSFDWLMPSFIADANELTLQITNGQNDHLFAGEVFSFPVVLGHFKNYFDLSENTYFEFGLTGMIGKNNIRGFMEDSLVLESSRLTTLAGADLTILWEPVNRAKYYSFLWRSEIYYADKEMPAGQNITALGGYSYTEYKFHRQWQFGVRFDYTQPFMQNNSDLYLYQVVPYITWWQSPWVRMRLQFNHLNGKELADADNIMRLQVTWAIGPHKHDRY